MEAHHRLEDLPLDLLARIFGLLVPEDLSSVERVCHRFRSVVVQHSLWCQRCLAAHPAIAPAASSIDASAVPLQAPDAVRCSAFFKCLHSRLTAPAASESLIASAILASSTDHPQEDIAHVLSPTSRSRNLLCYWSSRGSQDPDSREALAFQLAHPLCLVTEVQLRPFRAYFQWGSPIYAPKAVRFRLGGLACFDPQGRRMPPLPLGALAAADLARELPPDGAAAQQAQQEGEGQQAGQQGQQAGQEPQPQPQQPGPQTGWVWESPAYAVEPRDALQRFPIPPTLCVGGYLRVELLGKRQRQAADDAYYTCVCYLRAVGTPLHHFQLRQLAQQAQRTTGWQLAYLPADPLEAEGGLLAVSEGGRLVGGDPAAAHLSDTDEAEFEGEEWGEDEDGGMMPPDDSSDDTGTDGDSSSSEEGEEDWQEAGSEEADSEEGEEDWQEAAPVLATAQPAAAAAAPRAPAAGAPAPAGPAAAGGSAAAAAVAAAALPGQGGGRVGRQ